MNKFPLKSKIDNTLNPFADKRKFHYFVSRETSFMRDQFWTEWIIDQGCRNFYMVPSHKGVYDYYADHDSYFSTLKSLGKKMEKDWAKHRAQYEATKQTLFRASDELVAAVASRKRPKIIAAYEKLIQKSFEYGEYIWTAWSVIHFYEPVVAEKFSKKLLIITSVDQPIEYLLMAELLFETKDLGRVASEFSWLKCYRPDDEPFTLADFAKIKKDHSLKETKEQLAQVKSNGQKYQKFLKTIKSADLRKKVDMVHTYAYLKTDRMDTYRRAMYAFHFVCKYLAGSKPGWTLKDTSNLSITEIYDWLKSDKMPNLKNTQKQAKYQALYGYDNNGIIIINDQKKIDLYAARFQKEVLGFEHIEGMVACAGKATGKVVIVKETSDISKMKQGNILVAKFTYPSYAPYIKIAAAIVTDDGGLTSHAAIVSRELNVPCIVGTKVATTVLKDGEMVEVDANKGIVRKI